MSGVGSTIDPQRLQRLEQLFDLALSRPAAERDAFLQQACADEPGLLATLRAMLDDLERTSGGLTGQIGVLADQASAPADRSGERIGRYRLQARIRWGGMAEVYRAVRDDGEFSQEVALKIARADREVGAMSRWFEAERSLLARLRHPNICQIFDGGKSATGEPYFVMERIDGQPFLDVCLDPQTPWSRVLALFLQLCAAVAHSHRQWVVHRDIKPENVLVADSGQVKLLDFGIAAALQQDAAAAGEPASWYSPGYAAPEIIAGQVGGPAADIHSLGILLGKLLPRCPSLARLDLRRIAEHASAAEPADRYESVDALVADLLRLRDRKPISLRRQESRYVLWRWLQRRAVPIAVSLLALLLLGLAFSREVQLRQRAQAERDSARAVSDFLSNAYAAADPEVHHGQDISVQRFMELQSEAIAADASLTPDIRAQLQLTMGHAFANLGRYEQAEELLARALDNQLQTRDRHGLRWGQIRIAQAKAARQSGRSEEAEAILTELLHVQAGWPQTAEYADLRANIYSILAALEQGRRNLDLAADYIQQAMALYPQRSDRRDADISQLYYVVTLGSIQATRGDAETALQTFEAGLESAAKLGREANIPRLALLGWMGVLLNRQGRPLEAEPHLRQAIAVAEDLYPADHPRRSGAYGNLGTMLLQAGRLNDAEPLLRQALDGFESAKATRSPGYLRMPRELGELAMLREDPATARPLLEAHLQTQQAAYGSDSPRIVPALILLVALELQDGQPRTALLQAQQAEALIRTAGQSDQDELPMLLLLTAEAHIALGDRASAEREQARAQTLLASQLANKPRALAHALQRHAEVLYALGQAQQAAAACTEALAQLQDIAVAAHPIRSRCLLRLAQIHADDGDAGRARALLDEVAPMLHATLIEAAPSLRWLQALQAGLSD
ncbi:MAG: serine/threonine-protein kinase [Lysobacterales bacterium]